MNSIVINGGSPQEAREKAAKHFSTKPENIQVILIKDEKRIFGKLISESVYEARFAEQDSVKNSEAECDNEQVVSEDGEFDFTYEPDGVYLVIKYAKGLGKNVNLNMIMDKIILKNIANVNLDVIRDALRNQGSKVKIAEAQAEEKTDDKIAARVSLDKMLAFVKVEKGDGGKVVTFDAIMDCLKEAGVVHGIDEEEVRRIADEKIYDNEIVAAIGTKPVNGADGAVSINIDLRKSIKPKEIAHGFVDYYNLETFRPVNAGDVLARYKRPTKGVSGTNVCGGPIKANDGKSAKLPIGKNVQLSESGVEIIAMVDGVVEAVNGLLTVDELLIIEGDVDLSTGNIRFEKNIRIRGSVRARMSIISGGSVEVDGIVEGAVIAAKGNVILNGGVQGMGKGEIKAGGNITAKYIENAVVFAQGDIKTKSIIYSNVECCGSIMVLGGRSGIIGGSVRAMNSIVCQGTGSIAHTNTFLEVGTLPNVKREASELENEVAGLKAEIKELLKIDNIDDKGLNAKQRYIKDKLLKDRSSKSRLLKEKLKKLEDVKANMSTNRNSYISVVGTVHAGTSLVVNSVRLDIDAGIRNKTFKVNDEGVLDTLEYNGKA